MTTKLVEEEAAAPQAGEESELVRTRRAVAEAEVLRQSAESTWARASVELEAVRARRAARQREREAAKADRSATLAQLADWDAADREDEHHKELGVAVVERTNKTLERARRTVEEGQERVRATLDLARRLKQAITDTRRDLARVGHDLLDRERLAEQTREIVAQREAALARLVERLRSLTGERT